MYEKLMKHTVIASVIFAIFAMTSMIYATYHAPVMIEADSESISASKEIENAEQDKNAKELSIATDKGQEAYLCIPIDSNITDDKISLEANYVEQQLCITIFEQKENFYSHNKIYGNSQEIDKVFWNYKNDTTKLQLQLNGVYEHKAFCKNNMLYLEFNKPKESFDRIIVLDAGKEYGKYTQQVLNVLRDKLSQNQWNAKIYFTGMDQQKTSDKKIVNLANKAKADMLISVQVADDEIDSEKHGVQTIYNPTYFIPELNSIDLGDILEQNVCKATGATANGMIEAGETNSLIHDATVPVSIVQIGYISNKHDKALLDDNTYIERTADGIYQAIQDAYTRKEKGME